MNKSQPSPSRMRFDAGDYFGMFLIAVYLVAFGASVAGIFDHWLPVLSKRTQTAVAPKFKAPLPPPGALVGAGAGPRRRGPRDANRPVVPTLAIERRFQAEGGAKLHGLRFTTDGRSLIWLQSDDKGSKLVVWDRTSKKITATKSLPRFALATSPSGELVVLEDREKAALVVFDLDRTMEIGRIGTLPAPASRDVPPVFSGDGNTLVVAVPTSGKEVESFLIVYDVEKRKEMDRRPWKGSITSVAVNAAGNQIVFATVLKDRVEVHSWLWRENEEKTVEATGLTAGARLIGFTRDSGFLAVPTGGAEALLVEAFNARVARRLKAPEIANPRFRFATFFPDGKYMLAAGTSDIGAKLVVWSMADGKTVATAGAPDPEIVELQIAPDAAHAATIGPDRNEIVLWDMFAQVKKK